MFSMITFGALLLRLPPNLICRTSTATELVDLHILNLRQTVGSLEFTTMSQTRQEPTMMDDVRVFMKDVGYSRSKISNI
jgi:hypothetical protein